MCQFLLGNKFFILGLLIYLIPGFVFWAWVSRTNVPPTNAYTYPEIVQFIVFYLAFFVGILFAFPILWIGSMSWGNWYGKYGVAYFVISYGLLYLYWRRCKQKKMSKQKTDSQTIKT